MSWPEELTIWVFLLEAFPTVNEAWKLGIFGSPCGPNIRVVVISPMVVCIEITAVLKCFLAVSPGRAVLTPAEADGPFAASSEHFLRSCLCWRLPSPSYVYTTNCDFFCRWHEVIFNLFSVRWSWIHKFQNNRKIGPHLSSLLHCTLPSPKL